MKKGKSNCKNLKVEKLRSRNAIICFLSATLSKDLLINRLHETFESASFYF